MSLSGTLSNTAVCWLSHSQVPVQSWWPHRGVLTGRARTRACDGVAVGLGAQARFLGMWWDSLDMTIVFLLMWLSSLRSVRGPFCLLILCQGHPCSCMSSAAPSCLGQWTPAGLGCSGCISSQAVAGQRRVGPVFAGRSSPPRLAGLRAGAGFGHHDLCLQRLKRTTLCLLDEQLGRRRSEVWEAGVGEMSPNASSGLLKRWCSPARGWWFGFLSTLGPRPCGSPPPLGSAGPRGQEAELSLFCHPLTASPLPALPSPTARPPSSSTLVFLSWKQKARCSLFPAGRCVMWPWRRVPCPGDAAGSLRAGVKGDWPPHLA